MDLIITIAIVGLLAAIIWGSLRRGIQRVVGFVVLALMAAFALMQVSGESSATSNFFDNGQEVEPQYAVTAFDNFTQAVEPDLQSWLAAQTNGGDTSLEPDNGTGGSTAMGGANTGTSEEPTDDGSQGTVRAWW